MIIMSPWDSVMEMKGFSHYNSVLLSCLRQVLLQVFMTASSFIDADPVIPHSITVTMKRGQQTDEANNLGARSGLSAYVESWFYSLK